MKKFGVVLITLLLASCQAEPQKKIEVYLIGGQSNADGHGKSEELTQQQVNQAAKALFFHGNGGGKSPLVANKWIALAAGSGSNPKNAGKFGPEVGFAIAMQPEFAKKGVQLAVIKYAVGGSNLMEQWKANGLASKDGDGELYQNFQAKVAMAMQDLAKQYPAAKISLKGMIWHQGEADTQIERAPYYEENLTRLVADLRATYGKNLQLLIGQISSDQWVKPREGFGLVVAAQEKVANASTLNRLVKSQGAAVDLPSNRIHFNTQGQLLIGQRYAEQALKF